MKKIRTTKNLRLATCWLAMGAKYEGVDKTDKSHQKFTFSTDVDDVEIVDEQIKVTRGVDLDAIECSLANKELLVNAEDLFNAFQRLKSIIHSN